MNNYCFRRTHIHRAALLIAFYGFALSLLNAKAIVAIVFNIANFFTPSPNLDPNEIETNNLVNTARRVYFLYAQTTPDSRGLVYLNIFIASLCCVLLTYGNRELRAGYYWPFIAFCIYKMMYCSSEVLESTMIILHKVPMLRIDHQASTTHFILSVGALVISILFVWAYFMDIVFRAKRFMHEELLDPFTQLPRIRSANLLGSVRVVEASGVSATTIGRSDEIPPPPFDWKPGDPLEQRTVSLPAYHP